HESLQVISDKILKLQQNILIGSGVDAGDLDKLIEMNPTLGTLHYLKAVLLLTENKKDEALIYLRDAIRYSPDQPDFIALLNEVAPPQSQPPQSQPPQPQP